MYYLYGYRIGQCGCNVNLSCLCAESSLTSACGGFVAYFIQSGVISGIDVSSLVLVQLVQTAPNQTLFYLPYNATQQQQEILVSSFTGKLGGILVK